MYWETVKIYSEQKGRNTPYASIGYGRISFNAAACDLVPEQEKYFYARLLRAMQGKQQFIGVQLLENYEENTIRINRKKIKGKEITGFSIENKLVITNLFGQDGENRKTTRYNVKVENNNPTILIIYKGD